MKCIPALARWPLILLLAVPIGCAASPPADAARRADPPQADYRASGNEPFWNVVFGESTIDLTRLDSEDTVRAARPEPERLDDGWRFTTDWNGRPLVIRIDARYCTDSMSGRPFPHTVEVRFDGRIYRGCGGGTASLLTGEEWRVTRLEGTEITGSAPPTFSFAPGGVLSGDGGCNRFRAIYRITGEGIEIGPVTATRMACAEPAGGAREVRFFALLEQVNRFDVAADGSLELISGDRPIIFAERDRPQ